MRKATGMHHRWPADTVFVGGVAIGLQDAVELAEKLFWPFALATHTEVEDNTLTRRSILPQIRLMILAAAIMHLHIDGRFVSLDVTSGK